MTLDLPLAALGGEARVLAAGVGDDAGPVAATAVLRGVSVRPPAPVGLRWTDGSNGDATLGWTRRSRAGWRWADGGDAPLVEEQERYRVTVDGIDQVVSAPMLVIPAAARTGPVTVAVRQAGTLAESTPAAIIVPAI